MIQYSVFVGGGGFALATIIWVIAALRHRAGRAAPGAGARLSHPATIAYRDLQPNDFHASDGRSLGAGDASGHTKEKEDEDLDGYGLSLLCKLDLFRREPGRRRAHLTLGRRLFRSAFRARHWLWGTKNPTPQQEVAKGGLRHSTAAQRGRPPLATFSAALLRFNARALRSGDRVSAP